MPELPEVETVVLGLQEQLSGARLRRMTINDAGVLDATTPRELKASEGRRLDAVTRHGKYIVWSFGGRAWIQHLRMTGKMLPRHSDRIPGHLWGPARPSPQIRFIAEFDAETWVFYDARRFGTITATPRPADYFAARRLAPEIFAGPGIDDARRHFIGRSATARRPVKSLLLDQTAILGTGNIYADEALFRTGLHPELHALRLRANTAAAVFDAAVAVMREALAKRGTSMSDYLDVNGSPGVFQKYLDVYGRKGLPCRRCGTAIATTTITGRTSHFCPRCQGRPRARRV